MTYVRSFLPWIVLAVASAIVDWRWANACAAAVVAVMLVAIARRRDRPPSSLVIELSAAVYFAVVTALAFADPGSPVQHYQGSISQAWLAVTAWGSMAVGQPFTIGIARLTTPESVWRRPAFRHVNVVVTAVWAASFTASALAAWALEAWAPDATTASVIVRIAAFVVPIIFTVRYVRQAQAAAARQPARPAEPRPEPSPESRPA